MGTFEVGASLVELCSKGRFMEAIDLYYSDNVESIEGHSYGGIEKRTCGIEAVRLKNRTWIDSSKLNSCEVQGPFVSEGSNQFGICFTMDVTDKRTGKRVKGSEFGLYTVENERIVREEFFFLRD